MIIRNKNWLKLLLTLKGSIIPQVWQRVVGAMIFSAIITILYKIGLTSIHQPILVSVMPSVVLGLLLVFRTNTSYDRFWEGRKATGGIIIYCRALSRQIWVNIPEKTPEDTEEKIAVIRLLAGFLIGTKLHLRNESLDLKIRSIISENQYLELKEVNHIPMRIAKWIGDYFRKVYDLNYIDSIQLSTYNQILDSMVKDETACERILNTPIPLAYVVHLKHLLFLHCFALPFQMVAKLSWITILVVGIISFTLLGIEAIGLEIENPFGYDPNDLPLDNMCEKLLLELEELLTSESRKEYLID
ncbi:MAG: bestrophin family ion channel [Trichodesmium sp. St16_bin4-tuft]|nr:bestrophin family ion channel [Trichodesmium sp. St4_bin8_1]MDE5071346.1 bestrophin family ion channel [Trichodesmium sp. St5_bin8]MDE5078677.1 bestrophin family ion channel [Trichodesmium sp. St2_bin6]MDE5099573.1 bestrophin family ion channel [Trichodesmium sp. St16_bin4-tuft]